MDDRPVWSIVSLFVDKACRRQGVSAALIRGAVQHVAERGGSIVEAYPVDPHEGDTPDALAWTGIASAFTNAGFRGVERRSDTRPIVRLAIGSDNA